MKFEIEKDIPVYDYRDNYSESDLIRDLLVKMEIGDSVLMSYKDYKKTLTLVREKTKNKPTPLNSTFEIIWQRQSKNMVENPMYRIWKVEKDDPRVRRKTSNHFPRPRLHLNQ